MLGLLAKDFKLLFGNEKSIAKTLLKVLSLIICLGCFIAIEVFLFTQILNKISKINNASNAFLCLFLSIVSILIIASNLSRSSKLFFDEKDIEQLSNKPVSNSKIITSKMIFLFLNHYVTSAVFVFPLLIAYGKKFGQSLMFYYTGIFYPMFSFLSEMGIALILVYPYYILKKYLKKNIILRYVLTFGILFVGSYLYSKILGLFVSMVASNSINTLFTTENISFIIGLRRYQFPTNLLTNVFVEKNKIALLPLLLISTGIFAFGCSITIFAYRYVCNFTINFKNKTKVNKFKVSSVTLSLIKKELTVLTKNTNYSLSFVGLLVVQPFLAYLVINAINTTFTNGVLGYYLTLFPNFIPLLDILLLMLFTSIIGQGASQYITMEKKTIKVIKTIPVDCKKQMKIKLWIPLILSFVSFVITILVLLIGKIITFTTFIFGFILVTILLVTYCYVSLIEELSIRHHKHRSTMKSTLVAYALPLLYFVIVVGLSYFNMNIYLVHLIGIVFVSAGGIYPIIYCIKHERDLFLDLDTVN